MPVVLDANLLVALTVDDDRAPAVQELLRSWLISSETLHAPELLPYEVANALTRLVVAGVFPEDRIEEAWRLLSEIPITYHELREGTGVIATALQLNRQSAYDDAYLELANEIGAELWTFDGALARNAASFGLPVNLVS